MQMESQKKAGDNQILYQKQQKEVYSQQHMKFSRIDHRIGPQNRTKQILKDGNYIGCLF